MFTVSLHWNKIWELFAANHEDCIHIEQNFRALCLLLSNGELVFVPLSSEEGIIEKKLFGMVSGVFNDFQIVTMPDDVINETMKTRDKRKLPNPPIQLKPKSTECTAMVQHVWNKG